MEVITDVRNNIGWIKLNRPKVLNSINLEAVQIMKETLRRWENDDEIFFIVMYGAGEKGFCAGGDIKKFYDLKGDEAVAHAKQFFSNEYELDYIVHTYPKPIVAYLDGIVMGGGVGLTIGASHRIVTEKTKWAMPEMNIGFFPDVGASYFLNNMPGYIGRYLALTAKVINASDVLYVRAADYYMETDKWETLKDKLLNRKWSHQTVSEELTEEIKSVCSSIPTPSQLQQYEQLIDRHFQHETVEQIVESLKNDTSTWAKDTLETIKSKSPTSLKVALKQLIKGKTKSIETCFEMEKNMAIHFMKSNDFYEGVRAVLVDKDQSPKWSPVTIEEVTDEFVEQFFTPI